MRVLTKVAVGSLINRQPKGIKLLLEEKHVDYLNEEYIGDEKVWDSTFLHNKHGKPKEVSDWLASFGINKEFSGGDFAIASVMDVTVSFQNVGVQKFFDFEGKTCQRSLHEQARETDVKDLFSIPIRGDLVKIDSVKLTGGFDMGRECEDVKLYVSINEIEFDVFDKSIKNTFKMSLHVPNVDSEVEESLPIFNQMGVDYFGEHSTVGEAGLISIFKLDHEGVEVKQAAFLSCVCSSLNIITETRHPRVEVFDSEFFSYLTYKGKLMFACKVEGVDFVSGEGEIEKFESQKSWVEKWGR